MGSSGDDFANAVEIIPGKFYFASVRRPENVRSSQTAAGHFVFCIDDELLYQPFFADFGPLNLGLSYRFCRKVNSALQDAERSNRKVFFYCGAHVHQKANAAVLVGIYQVMFMNKTADEAYKPLVPFKPFVPFRDASCGPSSYHLTVLDVMKGIQKARDVGFLDWGPNSTWSLEEYEYYEQVENGDLNWIMPGKLVAFSGPAARGNEIPGYRLHTPEDYWDYYRRRNVTAIVRLNKKLYDRTRFTNGGFRHYDLYFPDGSCPSEAIILRFLELAEAEPGALAIHCKAGLGRTGVLILCFLMKHYRFTAEEAIGYIRVCRPGSVIGPQQNFMRDVEARMWQEGDLYRAKHGLPKNHMGHVSSAPDLMVAGRPATMEVPGSSGGASRLGSNGQPAIAASASNAKAQAMSALANSSSSIHRADSAASMNTSAGDMSLLQYKQHGDAQAPATPAPPTAAGSGAAAASLVNAISGLYGVSHSPASRSSRGSAGASAYSQRGVTPQRIQTNASSILASPQASHSPPTSPTTPTSASGARSSSAVRGGPSMTRSMPMAGSAYGRAPSADRASERVNPSALRATLHTDTLRAAERPRPHIPERNSQSAVLGPRSGGWMSGRSTPPPSVSGQAITPHSRNDISAVPTPPQQPRMAVARTLAPNGQPRKVPVTMLSQYHARMDANRPSSFGGAGPAAARSRVGTAASSAGGMLMNGSAMPGSAMSSQDAARAKMAAQMRYGLQSK